MKHIKIIAAQFLFLILIGIAIYMLYPKTNAVVNGNFVKFNSINANVIVISENPDFSNPRYVEMQGRNNISFDLKPGKYYWKSDNGIIESLKKEFVIDSKVGLGINRTENESNLVNAGNVKINITKTKDGMMVGRIILDVEESEKIEDNPQKLGIFGNFSSYEHEVNETYTGREE